MIVLPFEIQMLTCLGDDATSLRRAAFATVLYASGDNLMKLVEKERRRGGTRRYAYYYFSIYTVIYTCKQYAVCTQYLL
jgi:hypothetical protein